MSDQGHTITTHILPEPWFKVKASACSSSGFTKFHQFFLLSLEPHSLPESVLGEDLKKVVREVCLELPRLNPAQDANYESEEYDGPKVEGNSESLGRTDLGEQEGSGISEGNDCAGEQ